MPTEQQQQHTPGPWRLDNAGVNVLDPRETSYTLAHVKGASVREVEANARLIAAAPDLLAALVDVLPDLEHYVSTHGLGPDRRLDAARAAIAKARG